MMEIHIEDGLEKSRYREHIETVTEQFSPLPDPFIFLVYEEPDSPESVIGTTDIQPRSLLEEACRRKSSSSFTVNDIDIIIIRIDDPFLKDNDDALTGLIAHEVIHAVHRETGLEEEIEDASTQYSDLVLNTLANYEMTKDEAIDFLRDVVSTAVFCLKDIHANTDIIEAGFGDELAEYYYHQLGIDSYCPLPRFYQDETTITQIKEAIAFELQLTPAWLPFEKHDNERAKRMQEQIEECYELNIPETAKAIHGICSLYEQAYGDDRFIESFYDTLFEEIFDLVDLKLQD